MTRLTKLLAATLVSLAFCAGAAQAYVTVGQVAPPDPETFCNLGPTDTIQIGTTGGNVYAMPSAGILTSWSTSAGAGAGQFLSLKVYRPVSGTTYSVVAQDGPRALTPSVVNTFPIDIPVEAGDVLGLNDHDAPTAPDACSFVTAGAEDVEGGLRGDATDGAQLNFESSDTKPDTRVNLSATLETLLAAEPVTPVVAPPQSTTPVSGPPAAAPQAGTTAPPTRCAVPRLGSKTLAAARKALKSAGCRLGRVNRLKGATTKTGLVVSQDPRTGKQLAAGSKVAVELAPPKGA